MIAWQDFMNPTVTAIYNRDPSSISRYKSEWMPLLGRAGINASELDMGMSHNFLPILFCKENNIPYIENGVAFNIEVTHV